LNFSLENELDASINLNGVLSQDGLQSNRDEDEAD
jgi:hypothetical protein